MKGLWLGVPGIPNTHVATVAVGDKDKDILEQMAAMKHSRANCLIEDVLFTIAGFGGDARELWEIPEAVFMCKRLIRLGFPARLSLQASRLKSGVNAPLNDEEWAAFKDDMAECARLEKGRLP